MAILVPHVAHSLLYAVQTHVKTVELAPHLLMLYQLPHAHVTLTLLEAHVKQQSISALEPHVAAMVYAHQTMLPIASAVPVMVELMEQLVQTNTLHVLPPVHSLIQDTVTNTFSAQQLTASSHQEQLLQLNAVLFLAIN